MTSCQTESSPSSHAPSHYLDQIKATIACDRRISALLLLYTDLLSRTEAVNQKIVHLSHQV